MKDLFSFGVDVLRSQGRQLAQEQQNLEAAYEGVPPFRLMVSAQEQKAGLSHEEITESRQHHNCRPNRKTD